MCGEVAVRRGRLLRRRLGLKPKDWVLERSVRINGWIATGIVTLIAALTRLIGLGHPDRLMFDEIYYVKDAYALWHNGYESVWSDNADELFAKGNFSALTLEPAYVVHVAAKIAEVRGESIEEVARYTTENALRLYPKLNN